MGDQLHMGKVLKVLGWLIVVAVSIVFWLAVLWTSMISVGYLNLAMSYSGLSDLVDQAMEYPLEPDSRAHVASQGDSLVPARHGRDITITRKKDGSRFVVFDRGGGHLGNQGYIYHPEASDSEQVHQDAFGGFEGREVDYLIGSWWSYDAPEDR